MTFDAVARVEQAVLAACWDTDGSKIYTGSADKMGKAWDLQTDQNVQFAVHDQVTPFSGPFKPVTSI